MTRLILNPAQEVVPHGQRTLDELAQQAMEGHQRVLNSLCNALTSAIEVGVILLEAREKIGSRQEWLEWVDDKIGLRQTAADRYSRIAYYKDLLPKELLETSTAPTVGIARAQPGLMLAYEYLRGLPALHGQRHHIRTFDYEEARRLHLQGVPKKEIARLLGVSPNVIRRAVMSPAERRKHDLRKTRMKNAAARRRQHEQIKTANAPPDLAESYSLVRRALHRVQATHDTSTAKGRTHTSDAIAALYRAEDAIARAIKETI